MKNEPITVSPFFSIFMRDKIINCFRRVGYAPFTRECLKSPYIRHEICENQEDACLDELVNEYEEAKLDLKKEGFNVEGIFDADIPTATNLKRKETEYEQVKALIERKGGFSASSIYKNVGTMCITLGAVLKAQRYQLKKKATEERAKKQKKNEAQNRCLLDAQAVKEMYKQGGEISGGQMKQVIMYVLPAAGYTEAPSRYSTRPLINTRLAQLDKYWSMFIPDTQKEQGEEFQDEDL